MPDWRDDEADDEGVQRAVPGEGVRIVGPDPGDQSASRFPLPGDPPAWSDPEPRPRDPSSSRLPHWTDPPTGEVPRIPGGENANDDFETWSSLTGPSRPRFRTDSNDWNAGDFGAGELSNDDGTMIGELSDDDYEEAWGTPKRGRSRPARRGRGGRGRGATEPGVAPPPAEAHLDDSRGGLEGAPTGEEEVPEELAGSELGQRVITGVVMAIVAIACFAAGRPIAAFLITVIIGVCAFELFDAFRKAGYHTGGVHRAARLRRDGPHRVQRRRAGLPAGVVPRGHLRDALVPVRGRPPAAHGQHRADRAGLRLHRHPRRVRRAPRRRPRRHRAARRRRDLRHRVRHRRLLRRGAASGTPR